MLYSYGNGYSIRYAYRIGSKIEYYIHNIMAHITDAILLLFLQLLDKIH